MKRKLTLFGLYIIYGLVVTAQENVVSGKITAFNTYPMEGVKITAKKSKQETYTNRDGMFYLNLDKSDILICEAEGFKANRRKVDDNNKELKINMVFINTKENQERAVQKNLLSAEDMAFAMSNLQYSNVDYSMFTNVYDMIRSSFPGVTIIYEDGVKQFQVRTPSSLMASTAALIVLDGRALTGSNANLEYLSPYDVRKVEILKGPATSSYGSRGANGVILIQTRNGN